MRFEKVATAGRALIVLLLSAPVAAQPREVALPADWQVGETLRIEILKERVDVAGGKETAGPKSRSVVQAEVQARNETGYVFVWTYKEGWLDDVSGGALPIARLKEAAGDLRLVMQTDAAGVPQALLNLDEAVGAVKRMVDGFVKADGAPLSPDQTLVLEMLTSRDIVQSLLLRTPQVFYFICGAPLTLGETFEYNDLVPNPFGGQPFPSKGSILLQEVRTERNEAVIAWRNEIDREKGKAAIAEIVRRLMPDAAKLPEAERPTLEIRDQATYTIDTKTGWPRSVEWSRTVTAASQVRIDRYSIKTL